MKPSDVEQQMPYRATLSSRQKEREEIEQLTKEYLASGKTIQKMGKDNEQVSD